MATQGWRAQRLSYRASPSEVCTRGSLGARLLGPRELDGRAIAVERLRIRLVFSSYSPSEWREIRGRLRSARLGRRSEPTLFATSERWSKAKSGSLPVQ